MEKNLRTVCITIGCLLESDTYAKIHFDLISGEKNTILQPNITKSHFSGVRLQGPSPAYVPDKSTYLILTLSPEDWNRTLLGRIVLSIMSIEGIYRLIYPKYEKLWTQSI